MSVPAPRFRGAGIVGVSSVALVLCGLPVPVFAAQAPPVLPADPSPPEIPEVPPEPEPEPEPLPEPEPEPEPLPPVTSPMIEPSPESIQRPLPPPVALEDRTTARGRIAGGILLGVGAGFSLVAFTMLVGRAGHTDIGEQGLVTFDPVGIELQWRIPRAALGGSLGAVGAALAGGGGWLVAKNSNVPADPTVGAARIRRARLLGAIATGLGGGVLVSGGILLAAAGGEWASIPPTNQAEIKPEHRQSAHNTAVFSAWGLGLVVLGAGVTAAGIGTLLGAMRARTQLGVAAGPSGGGVMLTRRF